MPLSERQFVLLERDVEAVRDDPTEEQIIEWTGRRLMIESEEPPVKYVLNVICHNELHLRRGEGEFADVLGEPRPCRPIMGHRVRLHRLALSTAGSEVVEPKMLVFCGTCTDVTNRTSHLRYP